MIISLSGPSGIGKGFVKEKILQSYPFIKELVWFTTRFLRLNEQNSNRTHVSLSEFNTAVQAGKLVLVQDLYGNRYGLKRKDILPTPLIKLTELHSDNLKEALKINPNIICIGLVTSDFSLLRKRLSVVRKTESLTEIEQRIKLAKVEIKTILKQKDLFKKIIEVEENSEDLVLNQIFTVLNMYLKKKGG